VLVILKALFCFISPGPICQFDDECVTLKPCYGDAKCTTNAFGHYTCLCPRGWIGKNCSTDIDECASYVNSPCYHGGTCVNTLGSFTCQCVPGYTGNFHWWFRNTALKPSETLYFCQLCLNGICCGRNMTFSEWVSHMAWSTVELPKTEFAFREYFSAVCSFFVCTQSLKKF